MKQNPDELEHQIEALQQRVSTLCAAVLRISASLDLDTVLHEVVESARALTGARYGAITTVDEQVNLRSSSPPASRRTSTGSCWNGRKGCGSSSISRTCPAR